MQHIAWGAEKPSVRLKEGMRDYIGFRGALNGRIYTGMPVSEMVLGTARGIESALRETYEEMRVVGEESVRGSPCPDCRGRYWGRVCVYDDDDVIAYAEMAGSELQTPMSTVAMIHAIFHTAGHMHEVRRAIAGMWKHMIGFEAMPLPYHRDDLRSQMPEGRRGNAAIVLVQDGVPVASGEHAIREAGIPIDIGGPKALLQPECGMPCLSKLNPCADKSFW